MFENINDETLIEFDEGLESTEEHWNRMIQWAEMQPETEVAYIGVMKSAIREAWQGEDCAICGNDIDCNSECPLGIVYHECEGNNHVNRWGAVNRSLRWGAWAIAAREFLEQIEEVHERVAREIIRRNLPIVKMEQESD